MTPAGTVSLEKQTVKTWLLARPRGHCALGKRSQMTRLWASHISSLRSSPAAFCFAFHSLVWRYALCSMGLRGTWLTWGSGGGSIRKVALFLEMLNGPCQGEGPSPLHREKKAPLLILLSPGPDISSSLHRSFSVSFGAQPGS